MRLFYIFQIFISLIFISGNSLASSSLASKFDTIINTDTEVLDIKNSIDKYSKVLNCDTDSVFVEVERLWAVELNVCKNTKDMRKCVIDVLHKKDEVYKNASKCVDLVSTYPFSYASIQYVKNNYEIYENYGQVNIFGTLIIDDCDINSSSMTGIITYQENVLNVELKSMNANTRRSTCQKKYTSYWSGIVKYHDGKISLFITDFLGTNL